MRSGELLAEQEGELRLDGAGKPHQIPTQMQRLRDTFLKLGFDEIQTPIIVEDEEVYRQYGPEAPIILDRCYYLAGLPKPDIGLSNQKYQKIVDLGIDLDEDKKGPATGAVEELQTWNRGCRRFGGKHYRSIGHR